MKQYKYTVYYLNDMQEHFYCLNFTQAIILGMAHAISKGWDMRIKYIYDDEKDEQIQNIQFPQFEFKLL